MVKLGQVPGERLQVIQAESEDLETEHGGTDIHILS